MFGLLVILLSLFSSTCSSKYLSLTNENLNCLDNNCNIDLNTNQKLKINELDPRIIDLVEEKNGKNELINYLFYSTDINDSGAYSGKPLEILISLKNDGLTIENLKLIKHSEPILLTGIPIEKLLEAISFYKGQHIEKKINIGDDSSGEISIPIIAGATVTSLILHETILDTSKEVSKILGKISNEKILNRKLTKEFKKMTWDDLIKNGAIKNYKLDTKLKENENADNNSLLIDLYFADLKHESIGKNILESTEYEDLFKNIKDDESAIIILNNGEWSFKGSGFARGGIFDRFRIEQNNNTFIFREQNFKYIDDLNSDISEEFKETGIFIINNPKYKPVIKWDLVLLVNYNTYKTEYNLPKECYKEKNQKSKIRTKWETKINHIILFLSLWITTLIVFLKRDSLAKNSFNLSIIYNCILVLDIYIIGIIFEGQPSVVNVIALIDNFFQTFKALLFDPCLFLGWVMISLTIFIWGKALFCGWICPFGALQELLFKIRSLTIKNDISIEMPNKLHNKIKYLRYIIFITLVLTTIFISFTAAEKLAEIEPFKTIWIIGINNREGYYKEYTILTLLIGIITYRFFCRFICPLGAFLSLLSKNIYFNIKRRGTCKICRICRKSCNSKAIDEFGHIDSKECFGCFTCVNNMYNETCPPVKNITVRKKYEKNWW